MNIFLDTNILLADPYFSSDFSKLFLRSADEGNITIFVPSICLDELFFKFTDKGKQLLIQSIQKAEEFKKWTKLEYALPKTDLTQIEQTIRTFYQEKINKRIIRILDYKSDYFPKLIDKAVKGIPPFFTDKKEEFRDSIIWTIIAEHVNNNPLIKSYLISKNYNDFWNTDKTGLHPSLKNECESLLIVDSLKSLFDLESDLINYKKLIDFEEWLIKQNVTEQNIKSAIQNYLWYFLSPMIDEKIKMFPIKGLIAEHDIGYIVPDLQKTDLEVDHIISITPVEDFAVIEVLLIQLFEGRLYYPNYNKGDLSNYNTFGFKALIKLVISFEKDLLYKPISVEIKSISVK